MLQSEPYATHLNWDGKHPDYLTLTTRGIAPTYLFLRS